MHTVGEYIGAQTTTEGELVLSFCVADGLEESLEALEGKRVVLDVKKYNEKRSLNANSYFWKLCDEIATKLGTTKDIIYLLKLREAGQWTDVELIAESLPILQQNFRYVDVLDEFYREGEEGQQIKWIYARCYIGSSQYDTAQMSKLINETVYQAQELGIDTWSDDEIERLMQSWNPYR